MANDNNPQVGTSTAAAATKTYNGNTYTKTTPTDDFKGEVMGPATDGVVPVKMKRGLLGSRNERRYAELKLSDYPDLMGAKVGDEFEIKVKGAKLAKAAKTPDAQAVALAQVVKAAPKTVDLKKIVTIAAGADAVLQHVFQLSQEEQSRRVTMVNTPPFAMAPGWDQRATMLKYLNQADTSAEDVVALFDWLMTDTGGVSIKLQARMEQFVEVLPRMDDQAKAGKILQGMCREVAGRLGDGTRKLDEKCKLLKDFFFHMNYLGTKLSQEHALPSTPQSQQNTAELKIALFREIAKAPRMRSDGLLDVFAVLPRDDGVLSTAPLVMRHLAKIEESIRPELAKRHLGNTADDKAALDDVEMLYRQVKTYDMVIRLYKHLDLLSKINGDPPTARAVEAAGNLLATWEKLGDGDTLPPITRMRGAVAEEETCLNLSSEALGGKPKSLDWIGGLRETNTITSKAEYTRYRNPKIEWVRLF